MKTFFTVILIAVLFAASNGFTKESNWDLNSKFLKSASEIKSEELKIYDKSSKKKPVTEKIDIGQKSKELGVPENKLQSIFDYVENDVNKGKNEHSSEDTTDAMKFRILNGNASGENFGYSVSSAGDVNGDGYSDIIVGARNYSSTTGRAYIYYCEPSMDNTPDVILTGEAVSNYFGWSVSTAGDVNGDGYSDVIVGAVTWNASFIGRAYLYYGGSSMDNTADVILTGEGASNYFGYSVSSADDVNGDGYSDVIIGAYNYNFGTGRAYVYYGGSSMNNTADVTFTGEASGINFGNSVSGAGDVNGDGYSDVIVGAYIYSSATGRAYVYYGGSSMNNIADVTITGEAINNYFGYSVSSAGDVNGDGYSDVIIGAYAYSSSTGRAYVYYGGSSMNNTADVTMTGEAINNSFGYSVSTAGDINGDGYSDVIVGAYGYSTQTGRAYVYYGGSSMNNTADVTMTGEAINNNFGYSVSSAGDINGDGYSDLIVGAYGYSSGTGRVMIYTNSMTGTDIADQFFTGENSSDIFGFSVSSAGDFNGDGYKDIIIGAPTATTNDSGKAYIFYGGVIMNNTPDLIFRGYGENNYFGWSVSSAGDFNADGFSDVIIGAHGYSSYTGRAYVYYGGATPDTAVDLTFTGGAGGSGFGESVSSAGDFNGDGYSDVMIGAPNYKTDTGRAYIYFGGPGPNNVADITMTGEQTSLFGISVSTAGDVNGDGYTDVIIGADRYSSYTGRAYIYYGNPYNHNTADVIMTGEGISNYFGSSVSSAGDVNGDGYSDVIVGAFGYSSSAGRAYVYYGGNPMNNDADLRMTGGGTSNDFGFSVSGAGDVNGDGYSDILIGADGINSNAGAAFVYFGGKTPDTLADITMYAEVTGNYFGTSLASAGDMNNDGFGDILIGAKGYSSSKGRAYLYLSSSPPVKPNLISVNDVPNDQGGKVNITWTRSGYDVYPNTNITLYSLERRITPASGWEVLATATPSHYPKYSYIASTPFDSGNGQNGMISYRVIAKTSSINEYWTSNIISGHSVDNIPPLVVLNLAGYMDTTKIQLKWKKSTAPDLSHYNLYRNGILQYSVYDTLKNDTAMKIDTIYIYRVRAVDIHGNESPFSDSVQFTFGEMNLNLKVLIAGMYGDVTGLMIRDTVRIYLRNVNSPFAIIDSSTVLLDSLGQCSVKIPNVTRNNSYYISIIHRNSLETWSKVGGALFDKSYTDYNFTTDSAKAYGNNMVKVGSKWCIINGDCNRDNYIDGSDYLDVINHYDESGYLVGDNNGDSYVDGSDYLAIINNYDGGAITPLTYMKGIRTLIPRIDFRKMMEQLRKKN